MSPTPPTFHLRHILRLRGHPVPANVHRQPNGTIFTYSPATGTITYRLWGPAHGVCRWPSHISTLYTVQISGLSGPLYSNLPVVFHSIICSLSATGEPFFFNFSIVIPVADPVIAGSRLIYAATKAKFPYPRCYLHWVGWIKMYPIQPMKIVSNFSEIILPWER